MIVQVTCAFTRGRSSPGLGIIGLINGKATARVGAFRRLAAKAKSQKEGKRDGPQIPYPKYQRSHVERKPKAIVAAMAFGISLGTLSTIGYFESTRNIECEAGVSSDSAGSFVEPITGTNFPLNLFGYETSSSVHWLVGSSVRCMLNMCSFERARAYAFSLYVSQESLEDLKEKTKEDVTQEEFRSYIMPLEPVKLESQVKRRESMKTAAPFIASSRFAGAKSGYIFKKDQMGLGYYLDKQGEAIEEMKGTKKYPSSVLRLVMLRDVKCDHVAHGFDRTLLWRVRDAQNKEKQGPGKDTLRKFTDWLRRQKEWKKGTILDIVRVPHGKVIVRVDGEEQITLHSEIFSWALMDAYYGPKGHFSAECKDSIIQRTNEIIRVFNE